MAGLGDRSFLEDLIDTYTSCIARCVGIWSGPLVGATMANHFVSVYGIFGFCRSNIIKSSFRILLFSLIL